MRKEHEHGRGLTKDNPARESFSLHGQFPLFLAPVLPYGGGPKVHGWT